MNANKIYPWYFSSGAIVLYLLFIVAPALLGIYYSFTDWNSYSSEKNFIGLEHFRTILAGDPTYLLLSKTQSSSPWLHPSPRRFSACSWPCCWSAV
ncbi:hypothetical protein Q0F98_05245 [Paenibacillus amylolyticus]|nr:hypothetical protein Q0F98_05245 [Paenibacillus amylolyticus]